MTSSKRKLKNCNSCNENDDYDDMVCCDLCDGWHHFICVGVTSNIEGFSWFCQVCLSGKIKQTYTTFRKNVFCYKL